MGVDGWQWLASFAAAGVAALVFLSLVADSIVAAEAELRDRLSAQEFARKRLAEDASTDVEAGFE